MLPSFFYIFVIITLDSILGSSTTKDANHDELAFSAVAAADATIDVHFGLVQDNCKTQIFLKLYVVQETGVKSDLACERH